MKINYITKQLIRSSSRGYLSTHFDPNNFGVKKINAKEIFPYSTFTLTAFDYDISPIVLLSNLSEHTTNINKNSLVSLMLCEEQKLYHFFPKFKNSSFNYEDPMSRPRITLVGNLKKTKDEKDKRRFISRHPASRLYSGFTDMNFYKMKIIGAHLIGGFASVKWFKKKDLITKETLGFNDSEENIIKHMNDCHQNSLNLYSTKLIKSDKKKKNWRIVGIDPEGFDLRNKDTLARYCFEESIADVKKLRGLFVSLHKKASSL